MSTFWIRHIRNGNLPLSFYQGERVMTYFIPTVAEFVSQPIVKTPAPEPAPEPVVEPIVETPAPEPAPEPIVEPVVETPAPEPTPEPVVEVPAEQTE
jgi:hypothetical protein